MRIFEPNLNSRQQCIRTENDYQYRYQKNRAHVQRNATKVLGLALGLRSVIYPSIRGLTGDVKKAIICPYWPSKSARGGLLPLAYSAAEGQSVSIARRWQERVG